MRLGSLDCWAHIKDVLNVGADVGLPLRGVGAEDAGDVRPHRALTGSRQAQQQVAPASVCHHLPHHSETTQQLLKSLQSPLFFTPKSGHMLTAKAQAHMLNNCQIATIFCRVCGGADRGGGICAPEASCQDPRSGPEWCPGLLWPHRPACHAHSLSPRHCVPLSAAHWAVLATAHEFGGTGSEGLLLSACTMATRAHLVDCQVSLVLAP